MIKMTNVFAFVAPSRAYVPHGPPKVLTLVTDSQVTVGEERFVYQKNNRVGGEQDSVFFAGVGDGTAIDRITRSAKAQFPYNSRPSPRIVAEYLETECRPYQDPPTFVVAGREQGRLAIIEVLKGKGPEEAPYSFRGAGAPHIFKGMGRDHEKGRVHGALDDADVFTLIYDLGMMARIVNEVDTRLQMAFMLGDGTTRMLFHQKVPMDEPELARYVELSTGIKSPEDIAGGKELLDDLYRKLMAAGQRHYAAVAAVNRVATEDVGEDDASERAHFGRLKAARAYKGKTKEPISYLMNALMQGGAAIAEGVHRSHIEFMEGLPEMPESLKKR